MPTAALVRRLATGAAIGVGAVLVSGSAPAAPATADLAVFVAAGSNPMPPIVPSGRTATVASLRFTAGVVVEHGGGEDGTARVRFEISPGLRWGTDEPDPSESCTGTPSSGECQTSTLSSNVLTQRQVGWVWDVVADRAGDYVLRAEILSASTSDPDTSNNQTTVTIAVTEPPTAPPAAARPTASAVRLTPAKPKAGGSLVARVHVSAGGTPVRPARVSCAANVGGTRLQGVPRATSGAASCTYRIPRGARGKTLRGTVVFTARAQRFVKRFSATVG